MIEQVVNLFNSMTEELSSDVSTEGVDKVLKAIQALIEVCGGNFQNQEEVVNAHVLEGINIILGLKTKKTVSFNHFI